MAPISRHDLPLAVVDFRSTTGHYLVACCVDDLDSTEPSSTYTCFPSGVAAICEGWSKRAPVKMMIVSTTEWLSVIYHHHRACTAAVALGPGHIGALTLHRDAILRVCSDLTFVLSPRLAAVSDRRHSPGTEIRHVTPSSIRTNCSSSKRAPTCICAALHRGCVDDPDHIAV